MRTITTRRLALAAALVFGCVAASSAADLTLTLVDADTQSPLEGATVEIYLSTGIRAAESGPEGLVSFESVVGRGFWVEIDGVRLSDFYYVVDSPIEIQVRQDGGAR